MNKFIYLLILTCFSFTTPCFAASKQKIFISSEPSQAQIFIDGHYRGETPKSVPIPRNHSHRIIVQKEGYGSQYIDLKCRISNRNLQYGLCPIVGTAIGATGGFIMVGGDAAGLGIIVVLAGAGIGLAAGSAVGILGLGYSLVSGSGKKLSPNKIHFNLLPK